jgi:hypothetical protein
MTKMGQLDESALPTFVKPMKSLVDKVSALYNDIKNDVMGFYNVRLHNLKDIQFVEPIKRPDSYHVKAVYVPLKRSF